jgi:L-ribulose-5-phosphate 4-epimerase
MLENLKKLVCEANKELPRYGLVTFTWGNVSAIDRDKGLVVIKPSGVEYDAMKPEDMVVVDLGGKVVEGKLNPSSDTPTHLVLYKAKAGQSIGGIVHTHSTFATVFAEANMDIPALGTTGADYIHGDVLCTRRMTRHEVGKPASADRQRYERETGSVILETFKKHHVKLAEAPAVLVANHGPFTWGKDALEAVHNAVVLEEIAKMAYCALSLNPRAMRMQTELIDKHYYRKHGENAYYGQTGRPAPSKRSAK